MYVPPFFQGCDKTRSQYKVYILILYVKINHMRKATNIKILRTLCIITAISWSILAILSINRGSQILIPTIMFGSTILEILFFFLLKRKLKSTLQIFLVFTILNLILTITDQIGIWDYILLSIYILKVVFIIIHLKLINRDSL
jgi:hypothetical protein